MEVLKFDTKVQFVKYRVLKEVAREEWAGTLESSLLEIPKRIIPGKEPTMRCCVYKERAIVAERIQMAMGGNRENPNPIQVVEVACEECPIGGYEVTNACQGCLAHQCKYACKFGAITIDENRVAHVDKTKCKQCGACAKICPYHAIRNYKRPCERACKVKAISTNEDGTARIRNSKCISCGACVYQCPFGAITDVSYILDAIRLIKNSNNNQDYKVFAVVAPAIASQFTYAKLGQVLTGIKQLGFYSVVEAAMGADMVAKDEAVELAEKGFLLSSCCPAFVSYVEKHFPQMLEHVSHNRSPMAVIGEFIKKQVPNSKVVFIGPCTAKKAERTKQNVAPFVDVVLTFEELQALFDSRDIEITTLEESTIDNASFFGRIFARSGGLAEAAVRSLEEQGVDFKVNPTVCNGIEECKLALMKKSKNLIDSNFIEGMACLGGCVGGAGCLTHGEKNKVSIDNFGKTATKQNITDEFLPID
ncbi:MAG: 4Fe-4S dicluster domain-containing protein [Clostridia bacterium]|nr:4Fe-4S dicluster domain-containing protein [Clostridia bacterium]